MAKTSVLDRARRFLVREGRLLDRRIFECRFEGGSSRLVLDALRAYRNVDGGFGHALEPDLRAAESQPINAEIALQVMDEVDASLDLRGLCEFLARVADANGALSPALPGASEWPCADHWRLDWAVTPAVNPTAAIVGYLEAHGLSHPWIEKAGAWCREQIETQAFGSAHTIWAALRLVSREDALRDRMLEQLEGAEWFLPQPPVTTYGVTPLHLAPGPDALLRPFFDDGVIEGHLDDLLGRQEEDGGWPILWNAPGPAAHSEWRGRWTLDALLTLRAYGRI